MFNRQQEKSSTPNTEKSKESESLVLSLQKDLDAAKVKLEASEKKVQAALELFNKILKGYSIVPSIKSWVDEVSKGD